MLVSANSSVYLLMLLFTKLYGEHDAFFYVGISVICIGLSCTSLFQFGTPSPQNSICVDAAQPEPQRQSPLLEYEALDDDDVDDSAPEEEVSVHSMTDFFA